MGINTFVLLLVALAGGCSEGDLGAVSVRWRIVDLASSIGYDPKQQAQGDGSCAGPFNGGMPDWVVHNVRLTVTTPETGDAVPVDMKFVVFACRQREATTSFNIPLGRFAFNLCAFSNDPGICDEGITPAPAVRIVKKAEIINLDVIEIGVRSRNSVQPMGDSGVDDAGNPI